MAQIPICRTRKEAVHAVATSTLAFSGLAERMFSPKGACEQRPMPWCCLPTRLQTSLLAMRQLAWLWHDTMPAVA
jgi:hypothetical protein